MAGTLVAGEVSGQPLDVLIAGDDDGAKATLAALVRARGLNPVDVGALDRARQLEVLGLLGITLQSRLNTGFGTAWKLVLPAAADKPATPSRRSARGLRDWRMAPKNLYVPNVACGQDHGRA